MKDLPDIALLASAQSVEATRVRAALQQTFRFRRTHDLPAVLPAPAPTWAAPYGAMAREDRLTWPTLADVTRTAQSFLDPVLAGELDAAWNPKTWNWDRQ